MALSDVIKKKQTTSKSAEKEKGGVKNLLDDVRVVIGVIVLACVLLIVLIVFGTQNINNTMQSIEKTKTQYKQNQIAIANLRALQARSSEYKEQIEKYDVMISKEPLEQMQIMIDLEKAVESHNCNLTEMTFSEVETNDKGVNQIAVNITVTGKYADVVSFCHDTVNDGQIKRIDTINMTVEGNSVTAKIVVVEFSR